MKRKLKQIAATLALTILTTTYLYSSSLDSAYEGETHTCSRKGFEIIKLFEDFRANVYYEIEKVTLKKIHPTIGFGHHILSADEGFFDRTITEPQANSLLVRDIETRADISRMVTVDLEKNQRDALTSFCFNVGIGHFRSSTLLKKINEGEIEGAYEYFGHWRDKGLASEQGMIKRRFTELFIFSDKSLDPEDNTIPSAQWGIPSMPITDENWGLLERKYRREAVKIATRYSTYK